LDAGENAKDGVAVKNARTGDDSHEFVEPWLIKFGVKNLALKIVNPTVKTSDRVMTFHSDYIHEILQLRSYPNT
jgi:hypothetical protein